LAGVVLQPAEAGGVGAVIYRVSPQAAAELSDGIGAWVCVCGSIAVVVVVVVV
jgi:hypothetical protein